MSYYFQFVRKWLVNKMEGVAKITQNLDTVFLAKMMIQMVENVGHIVSQNVQRAAYAKNYLVVVMFVIVIVDHMLHMSII